MWVIVAMLLVLWFYGLITGVVGNLIHLLLVMALAVLMFYAASRGVG
jgi:hypothetical protein